MGVGNNWLEAH